MRFSKIRGSVRCATSWLETYVRVNDPAGAYREYIRAADLMPANLEAQLKAGQMLLLARQFEDAKIRADGVPAKDRRNLNPLTEWLRVAQ